jgi:hypothetical protein
MRLRQIALAASDLDETVGALTDVLGIEVGFVDPGVGAFGLVNAVMPVGETFLEVVSPVRDDATAKRWIEKRGGDAGYMVILQCDDVAALGREVARAEGVGAKKVWEGEHEGARTVHFHPRELGAILSFDGMPAWDDWVWGGPDWRDHVRTATSTAIAGAELASADPEQLASRWGEVVGTAPARDPEGRSVIALPRGGRLVFVPGDAGDALVGVELALADRAGFTARAEERGVLGADGAATIAGVRFIPAV